MKESKKKIYILKRIKESKKEKEKKLIEWKRTNEKESNFIYPK